MKIPLTWLKDYVDTSKSPKEIAADFTQLGLMLDKPLDKSNVLDLEQRLNRSDLLSIIGCARDLSSFEDLKLKLPKGYSKPGKTPDKESKVEIKVETGAVHRFQTRVFKGLKVGPSPAWLADRLKAYGMEPKNNIVDITNFVMIEYGQPMHAQDISRLKAKDITIRQARDGEKLTTLLGTEVKLDEDTFVLTSGGEVTVIGGIVGGKNTGVTNSTTDIILDSGNYDSRVVRRTSRKLKIANETVSHYDKFLDPRTIDHAMARATELILEIAGGTYYANDDYYPSPVVPQNVTLRMSRLKLLSGMDISMTTVKKILKSLEYVVTEEGEGSLTLEVPYFRTDIEVEDDLISDILRIHDYTNIPLSPLSTPVPSDLTPDIFRFEDKLRDLMVAQGSHEHITNSLTSSSGDENQIILVNALTSDLNALRTGLEPGLKHVLDTYKKHKLENVSVFEIGKVFQVSLDKYLEGRLLSVMFTKDGLATNSLATLMSSLGITSYAVSPSRKILVHDNIVGYITPSSFTLVTSAIMPLSTSYTGIVSDFDHTTSLDLSLLAPSTVKYANIIETLSSLPQNWKQVSCKNMTKMDDKTNNYLLSFTWDADSKTIDVDKSAILKTLKEKLKITSKS